MNTDKAEEGNCSANGKGLTFEAGESMRVRRQVGIALFVFGCCFARAQNTKPLATEYVPCVRNKQEVDIASRKVQTPILVSKRGDRAFAVVAAAFSPGRGCRNTSMLYVAEAHSSFRLVFQQDVEKDASGSIWDGNGIAMMRWSPSGERLLAKVVEYDLEDGFDKYVVFNSGDRIAREISLPESVWKRFKRPCVASVDTTGWIDDDRIEMFAKPMKSFDEEGEPDGTPSCVQKQMSFSFDVRDGSLQVIPTPIKR